MAHSGCCMVLLVLCLSNLLLLPALADNNQSSSSTQAPQRNRHHHHHHHHHHNHHRHHHHHPHHARAPTPSAVLKEAGNPLIEQLCKENEYSDLCSKVFKDDDKENWSKLKDVKKPQTSIDFAIALATKSSDYMGSELNSTRLEPAAASDLATCLRYYKDIIVDLRSASQDLKENPAAAKDFLKDAGYKFGFCKASRAPSLLQVNGILLRLVNGASLHIKHSDDPEPIFNFN